MLLLDDAGNGFRVDQNMTYKLRFNDLLGGAKCAG